MRHFVFPQGQMPAIGLGTWKMEDGSATAAVESAINVGYRHIDCAPIYLNEPDVGVALKSAMDAGVVKREDLWITSKLWCNRHQPDLVEGALRQTLADLQLDYLDLYMIHWPVVFKPEVHRPEQASDFLSLEEMPIAETWAALESCLDAGLCRNLGVCNFSVKKLRSLITDCRIRPSANQVECHPLFPQSELLEFCNSEQIQLVAYSPLGSGDRPERMKADSDPNLFELPALGKLAQSKGITTGQLLLAWSVTRGTVAIPKSANPARQLENLNAGSIGLSASELAIVDGLLDQIPAHRYVHGKFWEVPGGPYTVANLWDE